MGIYLSHFVWLLAQLILVITLMLCLQLKNKPKITICYLGWHIKADIISSPWRYLNSGFRILDHPQPPPLSPTFFSFPYHSFWAERLPPHSVSMSWSFLSTTLFQQIHPFLLYLVNNCWSFKMGSWEPCTYQLWESKDLNSNLYSTA